MVQHGNVDHGGEWDGRRSDDPDAAAASGPVRIVAGALLLTVNPVDGSEIETCPSAELPRGPRKLTPGEHTARNSAATPAGGRQTDAYAMPMLERDEERDTLARLLARGRSVRLSGPSGSGRSTLLDAVAGDVASLAPDGVVRLSGYQRTAADLLQELFAAVHDAPRHRPSHEEVVDALQGVGAVVVVDDLAFGGEALDELLDATPECAFLLAVTPDTPAPSTGARVAEVALAGLSRTASMELLEHAVRRPLTNEETDVAGDLWFDSEGSTEGLPLRFVQAGALLRNGIADIRSGGREASGSALVAEQLSLNAREALRFALALGGELPHRAHLPALVGDPQAGETVGELADAGLVTAAGSTAAGPDSSHYRLAAGVGEELRAAGYGDGADARARTAAHHYCWWVGHHSVSPARVGAEAEALLAALHGSHRGGNASAAVLLARTAAPVLAASLRWSVWERVLQGGREAARTSGEVAEEAYFHHELGVFALCTGQLRRAQAELDASIALRGALADQQGTTAGRRTLALVADLMAVDAPADAVPPAAAPSSDPEPRPVSREPEPAAYQDRPTAALAAAFRQGHAQADKDTDKATEEPVDARTMASTAVNRKAKAAGKSGAHAAAPSGKLSRVPRNRGNMAAAGAGALLAAVLGTIMGLGSMPDDGPGPSDRDGRPGVSSQPDDDESDVNADDPSSRSPQSDSSSSKKPESSKKPVASDSVSERPTEGSSEPGEDPSESAPANSGGGNSSGGSTGGSGANGGGDTGGTDGGTGSGGTDGGGTDGGTDGGADGGTDSGGTDGGTDTGGTDGGTDTGGTDGGTDGGTSDGGTADGGSSDGGTADGGTSDGGTGTPSPSPTGSLTA